MDSRAAFLAVTGLVAFTSCSSRGNDVSDHPPASPIPSTVGCTDASQLRQRSIDDRRQGQALSSDQAKLSVGNRAGFFASLAIIADLKCKGVTLAQADEALNLALEAARSAANSSSFYRSALHWGEANYLVTQVAATLVDRLPAVRPQ